MQVFLLQTLSHPYIVAYRDSFLIEGVCDSVVHIDGQYPRVTKFPGLGEHLGDRDGVTHSGLGGFY